MNNDMTNPADEIWGVPDPDLNEAKSEVNVEAGVSPHAQKIIDKLEQERDEWKRECNMYAQAWERELGGVYQKTHLIDALKELKEIIDTAILPNGDHIDVTTKLYIGELYTKLSNQVQAEVKSANGGRKCLTNYEEFMSVTDKIYDAVKTARRRFGQLNGQVTPEVWNENYEAMKKLSDAIDLFEKEDSRLSV